MKFIKFMLTLFCACCLSCCSHLTQNSQPEVLSAQAYLQLAQNVASPQKERYLIAAAKRYLQTHQTDRALDIITQLNSISLPPALQLQKQFLLAQTQLIKQQYQSCLSTLNVISATYPNLSNTQNIQWFQLAAQGYLGSGQPLQSINAYSHLAHSVPTNDPHYTNYLQKIWNILQQFNLAQLKQRDQPIVSNELKAWIELAAIIEQPNLNQQQLILKLNQWRQKHPQHIANGLLPRNLSQVQFARSIPEKIALLIPTTGPLSSSAKAIRNGFTAAYYAAKSKQYQPQILVLNTQNQDINKVYQQAVQQGAQLIVGPLSKSNLATLIQNKKLPVPTIALNSIANSRRTLNLYTFGLSPIDEAQQAATKDWQDQHHKAIIIAPNNSWGKNIANTFIQTWQRYGNQVIAQYHYNQRDSLSKGIRQLLELNQSYQRTRQLQRLLNRKLRSIPRRRKDFDSIFLVANNKMARQIQPLIRYYYAGNIPVYAISQVYTGTPSISRDRDLNHILFCDIPWVITPKKLTPPSLLSIRKNSRSLWPSSFKQHPKLYALGADAFDLTFQLQRMLLLPAFGNKAATGTLFITSNQHIYRQLTWAKVEKGEIVPIPSG